VRRVCVFSGSSPGADIAYRGAACDLGHRLAERGIELVYGGASVGLMGAVADAALEGGGRVIGVIPQSLVDREVAHGALSDLRVVDSMHERKAVMAERFVTPANRAMLLVGEDLGELLDGLAGWEAPAQPKWIDRAAT
jgi:uncharacterized protein (TIGR00730 family)